MSQSRMDRLIEARAEERRKIATERACALLAQLRHDGFEAAVVGSLAAGRFRAHSDVDVLAPGPVGGLERAHVERAVAQAMRGSGIPCDLIFACDLTPQQLKEFEHDLVEASGLRQARAEAGAGAATPGRSRFSPEAKRGHSQLQKCDIPALK